ncbi:MAG: stage III sporulation protein AD [Clostridia bacterium]|nr:stage III sporulation protein AD [Clostridia bacterium]
MILKILGVGICSVIINVIIKQYKPELAVLVNVCGGLLIFLIVVNSVTGVVNELVQMEDGAKLQIDIISPIMKVIGIGYITEFTAELAEDSGNKAISTKILLGGKIAICSLAIPLVKKLIATIFSII